MNNFRFIGHLETLAVMPELFKRQPSKWRPVEARGETNAPMIGLGASLLLRCHHPVTRKNWLENLPIDETDDLKSWFSMKRLLNDASKAIMAEAPARKYLSGEMGRAMISRLDAGSTIFWHVDDGPYHSRTIRFHLPLVTSPVCLLYSGPEMLHVPVGMLCYFNNHVRHCAGNFGDAMRLHLIFEMMRLDADDDERR